MNKIVTYSFCDCFLDRFLEDLDREYVRKNKNLSRLAIVFGGKRPALFVQRALSQRIKKPFFPPRFFTIDEWMGYVTSQVEPFVHGGDMDHCYTIFSLAKNVCPGLLHNRETFEAFLPWAREILTFIDQLDLEDISDEQMRQIQQNARIGYDVPDEINQMLRQIVDLRAAYHAQMIKSRVYSRGFQYRRASQMIAQVPCDEFDDILFANFFYFNRSEERVVKELYDRGIARLFFQGDQRRWPVFKKISGVLNCQIVEGEQVDQPAFDLKLYSAFDQHAQVCQAREILKGVEDMTQTVIVLPDPGAIIPLLSEISGMVKEFNISMGYPLQRSSLVIFLEYLFAAQRSRSGQGYYARDYLKVVQHPLIKNMPVFGNNHTAGVFFQMVEEALTGRLESELSGRVFLKLEEISACSIVRSHVRQSLESMGVDITDDQLISAIRDIHDMCFMMWEGLSDFVSLSRCMTKMLDMLVHKSPLQEYPLNATIAAKIFDIVDEFASANFSREIFPPEGLFHIFMSKVSREMIAFVGSPLKGLQILGLFETRALNFQNVIVLDANEGTLPHLNVHEALIPRDVMISLGLDRLEQDEEIQRYGFMRLISSARQVHLIYQENREKERSRFIEELIWEEEKKAGQENIVPVARPGFQVSLIQRKACVEKTPEVVAFLKDYRHSASSLNTYLKNPMEFYRAYVLGLRDVDDLLDEPENRQVGIFIHELLHEVFQRTVGGPLVMDAAFVNDARALCRARFERYFGKGRRADVFFLKRVIESRFDQFLLHEANRASQIMCIECLERPFSFSMTLPCGAVKFKCVVDRVDRMKDGSLMVLDYKTGHTAHLIPRHIDDIETAVLDRHAILDTVRSFQLPLYCYGVSQAYSGTQVNAGLYDLRTREIKMFFGQTTGQQDQSIDGAFFRALDFVIREITDPQIPFIDDE